jgi:drug/metabolite transporter (DMT)-like permease
LTVLLALAGSALFGGSDFLGGVVSRRASPLRVAALGQLTALVLAVPTALLADWERVTAGDAVWSLASGAAVAVGLGFFYSAMAQGLISLVVPLTAVISASIPVIYAIASGERPSALTFAGIGLALLAIAIVSTTPGIRAALSLRVALWSLASGGCFGAFVVLVSQASDDAGLWPVFFTRITSAGGLVILAGAFTGRRLAGTGPILPACLAIGTLEAVGIAAFVLALQHGPLAVASVVSSLYPVGSVLLAMVFLHERLTRHQLAGVALALCAVLLISVET